MRRPKFILAQWQKFGPYIRAVLLALALGFVFALSSLLRNQELGEILVILYGVAAIIWKIPSAITFKMALATIVYIPIVSVYDPTSELPDVFAVYGFLLLVIGLICAMTERVNRGSIRSRCEISNKLKKMSRKIGGCSLK